jgi:hypothetical protein
MEKRSAGIPSGRSSEPSTAPSLWSTISIPRVPGSNGTKPVETKPFAFAM